MIADTKVRQAAIRYRGPSQRTAELVEKTLNVFDDFAGSMSTRQVYYQLVSRGVVENNARAYDRVQRLVVDLRRNGAVNYDRVVDRTRGKHQMPGWEGVESLMNSAAKQYRRDFWSEQPTVVMVACEKQALEGIFAEVVDTYGASLWILRGYSSESFAFEWANEIKLLTESGADVEIAYFGDHDPSGLGIEQDAAAKLRSHGAKFKWTRWGLREGDFAQYKLINIPVKRTDSRAAKYLQQFGDMAAELDAMPPDELRRRIRRSITSAIDAEAWKRVERVELVERESLNLITKNWDRALEAVQS